jgi:hypothetical protein
MNHIPTRQPIRTTAADGSPIVLVPVRGGALPATVDAEDFDRLVAVGISPMWLFNKARQGKAYVRAGHPRQEATGGLVTIARLIMEAPAGNRVRYWDGDTLNLRRENLYLSGFLGERTLDREAAIMAQRAIAPPD